MTRRQLTIKPSCMREIATFPSDRAALLWWVFRPYVTVDSGRT